jgi:hypothetical protein
VSAVTEEKGQLGLDRGSVGRLQLRSGHQGQQERRKLNRCQGGRKRTKRSKVFEDSVKKLEKGLEEDETCLVVKKKYWDFWKCQFFNKIEPVKIVQNEGKW